MFFFEIIPHASVQYNLKKTYLRRQNIFSNAGSGDIMKIIIKKCRACGCFKRRIRDENS